MNVVKGEDRTIVQRRVLAKTSFQTEFFVFSNVPMPNLKNCQALHHGPYPCGRPEASWPTTISSSVHDSRVSPSLSGAESARATVSAFPCVLSGATGTKRLSLQSTLRLRSRPRVRSNDQLRTRNPLDFHLVKASAVTRPARMIYSTQYFFSVAVSQSETRECLAARISTRLQVWKSIGTCSIGFRDRSAFFRESAACPSRLTSSFDSCATLASSHPTRCLRIYLLAEHTRTRNHWSANSSARKY